MIQFTGSIREEGGKLVFAASPVVTGSLSLDEYNFWQGMVDWAEKFLAENNRENPGGVLRIERDK